jgi:hypothetical protein
MMGLNLVLNLVDVKGKGDATLFPHNKYRPLFERRCRPLERRPAAKAVGFVIASEARQSR